MALDRSRASREAPRWLPLLLDIALVSLSLLLDVRDLWFKLRWVGPHDTFAFTTIETRSLPTLDAAPLKPTTSFLYADQKAQRESGWSSFLQQCESLTALAEDDEARGVRYALGRNCIVGPSSSAVQVPELLLTSSVRVDSMAWAACELLYKHRKPPICHSSVVTQFQERYNFQNGHSFRAAGTSTAELTQALPGNTRERESYAAEPGSEVEAGVIELLGVVSKSSPMSGAVCVEGFILRGPGQYTSSVFGCGSPSFYRSIFVGSDIPIFPQYQRDKAWLTSNSLRVMGMTFLIRENRRSIFSVVELNMEAGGGRMLQHTSLLNFAASGSLYTLMIVVDLALLILSVCSVVEITRCMLWPLWKPLVVSEYQISYARTKQMGFALKDYSRVLQVTLLRSTPVTILTVVSRLLTWLLVIPSAIVWSDGKVDSGDVHAFLTIIRSCDLVVICVNAVWNMVVRYDEKRALEVVRGTYVSPLESIIGSGIAASISFSLMAPQISDARSFHKQQRLADRSSFVNTTTFANTFPVHLDSAQSSSSPALVAVYSPLLAIIGISLLIVSLRAISRYFVGWSAISRSLVQSTSDSGPTVHPSGGERLSACRNADLTSSTAGILMRSSSPPPSPTRLGSAVSAGSPSGKAVQSTASPDRVRDGRLPIEDMLDLPIRAKSLVRRSWALEKIISGQLLLLPPQYLEHGIVLTGRTMKTRCGFMDVVQPLLLTQEHNQSEDIEMVQEKHTGDASRSLR